MENNRQRSLESLCLSATAYDRPETTVAISEIVHKNRSAGTNWITRMVFQFIQVWCQHAKIAAIFIRSKGCKADFAGKLVSEDRARFKMLDLQVHKLRTRAIRLGYGWHSLSRSAHSQTYSVYEV